MFSYQKSIIKNKHKRRCTFFFFYIS